MSNRARVIVLFALLLVGVTSMMAAPDHDIEYIYYTDATKTVECGWRYLSCHGGVWSDGCRTAWYDVIHYEPC